MFTRLSAGLLAGFVLLTQIAATPSNPPSKCQSAIECRLSSPISVTFQDATLSQVAEGIGEASRLPIVPDLPAMQEAGYDPKAPINFACDKTQVRAVLNRLAEQMELAWCVKDEVIVLTTKERGRGKLLARTMPVADLVIPIPRDAGSPNKKELVTTEQKLIQLITSTIAPKTWADQGGTGTIDYFPMTMTMVINQTPDVQEQIAALLAKLRREQDDSQVTVEMRIITLSDDGVKKLGLRDAEGGITQAVKFLDDTQLFLFMETVQSDVEANVMQAPRLTCFSGQNATLDIGDQQSFITGVDVVPMGEKKRFEPKTTAVKTGFYAYIQPTLNADKSVSTNLGIRIARLEGNKTPTQPVVCTVKPEADCPNAEKPIVLTQHVQQPRMSTIQVETTVKIPEGKTALLSGWTHHSESYIETAPPSLARIPYVNRLFRSATLTKQKEHLLVLVTTRPVAAQEVVECKPSLDSVSHQEVVKDTPVVAKKGTIYSNKRSFSLGYTVDNVGSSKLAGIDVYFTRDGQKWERYPEAVKPTGSVPIDVADDGRYGFTLVAKSNAGLAKPAPKTGDEPHLWIEVDTTKPVAELHQPQFEGNRMILEWKATDTNLGDKPISLEWAASPEDKWQTIGEGRLANTGKYAWTMPTNLPAKVYLRLIVRDEADNTSTAQTQQPVPVDAQVPTIRDVRFQAPAR